jgi:hypothetical protein
MTSSGTYTSETPDFAGFIDDAFERVGVSPSELSHRHLESARRSMGFVFRDIENDCGYRARAYAIARETQALVADDQAFQLPAGTIDVLDAVYVEGSTIRQPLQRTDRYDHELLLTNSTSGRPSLYFVTREIPAELSYISDTAAATWEPGGQTASLNYQDRPLLVLWPTVSATSTLVFYRVRRTQDASGLSDDIDIAPEYHHAVVSGLAADLSIKFAPDRTTMLAGIYEIAKDRAATAGPNHGDTMLSGRWSRRRRRI